jgi:hypothetical protein
MPVMSVMSVIFHCAYFSLFPPTPTTGLFTKGAREREKSVQWKITDITDTTDIAAVVADGKAPLPADAVSLGTIQEEAKLVSLREREFRRLDHRPAAPVGCPGTAGALLPARAAGCRRRAALRMVHPRRPRQAPSLRCGDRSGHAVVPRAHPALGINHRLWAVGVDCVDPILW